jgi:hypothetical protein
MIPVISTTATIARTTPRELFIAVLASAEQQHYPLKAFRVRRNGVSRDDAVNLRCYRSHRAYNLEGFNNCTYRLLLSKLPNGAWGITESDIRHNHTLVEDRDTTTQVSVPSLPVAAFQSQPKPDLGPNGSTFTHELKRLSEWTMLENGNTSSQDDSDDSDRSGSLEANCRADSDSDDEGDGKEDDESDESEEEISNDTGGKGKQKERVPSVPSFVKFNTLKEEFKKKCGVSSTFPITAASQILPSGPRNTRVTN